VVSLSRSSSGQVDRERSAHLTERNNTAGAGGGASGAAAPQAALTASAPRWFANGRNRSAGVGEPPALRRAFDRGDVALRLICDTSGADSRQSPCSMRLTPLGPPLDYRRERRPKGALHVAAVASSPSRPRSGSDACPARGRLKIGSAAEAFRHASWASIGSTGRRARWRQFLS
jgi:hypothetical protein